MLSRCGNSPMCEPSPLLIALSVEGTKAAELWVTSRELGAWDPGFVSPSMTERWRQSVLSLAYQITEISPLTPQLNSFAGLAVRQLWLCRIPSNSYAPSKVGIFCLKDLVRQGPQFKSAEEKRFSFGELVPLLREGGRGGGSHSYPLSMDLGIVDSSSCFLVVLGLRSIGQRPSP